MTQPPPPSFPLAGHLGMSTSPADAGTASCSLAVRPDLLNPHGALHGGVLFTMVDTAMGAATLSVLPAGQVCASIDVELRFCRPVFAGRLTATAEVLKAGKKVVHLEARVTDADDELVAFGTGAFSVLAVG